MSSVATSENFAYELHAFLRETDPIHWSDQVAERARERWGKVRKSGELASAQLGKSARTKLDDALESLAALVLEHAFDSDTPVTRGHWMELRARLMPAYERLAAQLRAQALPVPTIRPTNWARIAFHVASGLGALLLLEVILTKNGTLWATGLFAGTAWFLETGRALSVRWNDRLMRVRFFQLIIHPHEHHRVNSATWYGTALLILALVSPPIASAAALAVLALGDPLAGLVGRRWGRTSVGGGRTLEGSIAFAVGGTLAALAVLALWHPVGSGLALTLVAATAAVAGALAEALSHRIDDNLAVPLGAAAGAWLAAVLLGVVV